MPNYIRDRTPGGTWFFTVVTYQRRNVLCDAPIREALRVAIKQIQVKYPFQIKAWVLMPDHFHCVWTLPPGDSNYSLRIGLLKRAVTLKCKSQNYERDKRSLSRQKHRESTLWQRRFWEHKIRNEKDLRHHVDYIHYNPVKHGHCQNPTDWPYSTVHNFISKRIYPVGWATPLPTVLNAKSLPGEV